MCGDYANNLNHPNTLGSCGLKLALEECEMPEVGGRRAGPHYLRGLCASLLADFGLSNTLVLNRFRVRRQFSGQIIIAEASQRF